MSRLPEFCAFIGAREMVRFRRSRGLPRNEWTEDPILARYRFCNVDREQDRVTKWIAANIRAVYNRSEHLWFLLVIARLLNNEASLGAFLSKRFSAWSPQMFKALMADRKYSGAQVFGAAYIVSTNGTIGDKSDYLADNVLTPLWEAGRADARPMKSCIEWADFLVSRNGIGDFLANQIVTDYKYTRLCDRAWDKESFAWAGPGTKRGLNRLFNEPLNEPIRRIVATQMLLDVRDEIRGEKLLGRYFIDVFRDLNNLANCFCEWDKYERARLGEGAPKQLFTPVETV